MKVAVVGATGMVGNVMLEVLQELCFPVSTMIPVASEKSVGKTIEFSGSTYTVVRVGTKICSCWDHGN
ncbi:MAG: hypothetical protein RL037_867 [Bacteroidota bacterium]